MQLLLGLCRINGCIMECLMRKWFVENLLFLSSFAENYVIHPRKFCYNKKLPISGWPHVRFSNGHRVQQSKCNQIKAAIEFDLSRLNCHVSVDIRFHENSKNMHH